MSFTSGTFTLLFYLLLSHIVPVSLFFLCHSKPTKMQHLIPIWRSDIYPPPFTNEVFFFLFFFVLNLINMRLLDE